MNVTFRVLSVVFSKEVLDNVRDRRSLLTALIYPLLGPLVFWVLLGMVSGVVGGSTALKTPLPIAGAEHAPGLVAFLEAAGIKVVAAPLNGAERAVKNHEAEAVLVVPSGFQSQLDQGRRPAVTVVSDASRVSAEIFSGLVADQVRNYGRRVAAEQLTRRGIDPESIEVLRINNVLLETRRKVADLFLYLVPPFVMFTVFIGGVYMAIDTTSGERERGSMEPLFAHPVPRWQFMLGKYLAACLFTGVALTFQLTAFHFVFRTADPALFTVIDPFGLVTIARLVLVVLPLLALAVAVQIIIAATTKSFKEAQTWLGLLPLLPALPGMVMVFSPISGQDWMMGVPILAQTVGMGMVVRGEAIDVGYLLLGTLSTLVATALLLRWAAHLFEREDIIFPG